MLLLMAVEDSEGMVDQVRSERDQAQGLLEITDGRGSDYSVDDNTETPLGDLVRSFILDYIEPDDESDDSAFETLYEPLHRLLTLLPNLKRFKCNDSPRCQLYIEDFNLANLTHISIPFLNDPEQLSLLSNFPLLKELELHDRVYETFYDANASWEYAFKPLSLTRLSYNLSSYNALIPLSLDFLRSITVSIVHLTAYRFHLVACMDALSSSVTSLTLTSEGDGMSHPLCFYPSTFTRFSQLQHLRLDFQHAPFRLSDNFLTLLLATTTITSLSIAVSFCSGGIIHDLFNAIRSTSPPHLTSIDLDFADFASDWEEFEEIYEAQHDLTRLIIRARDLGITLYGRAVDEHLDRSKSGKLMRDDPAEHRDHWTSLVGHWNHESLILYMKCFFLFRETQSEVGSDCACSIEEV
jgi:hypothetical protein